MSDVSTIAALRAENLALRNELQEARGWSGDLDLERDRKGVERVRRWARIIVPGAGAPKYGDGIPIGSRMLFVLAIAGPGGRHRDALADDLRRLQTRSLNDEIDDIPFVRVGVVYARRILRAAGEPDGIVTLWGRGYVMADSARELVLGVAGIKP